MSFFKTRTNDERKLERIEQKPEGGKSIKFKSLPASNSNQFSGIPIGGLNMFQCGQIQAANHRIIGGGESFQGEIPWQVCPFNLIE